MACGRTSRVWRVWSVGGPGGGIRRVPSCGAPVGAVRACECVCRTWTRCVRRAAVCCMWCVRALPLERAPGWGTGHAMDVWPADCHKSMAASCASSRTREPLLETAMPALLKVAFLAYPLVSTVAFRESLALERLAAHRVRPSPRFVAWAGPGFRWFPPQISVHTF